MNLEGWTQNELLQTYQHLRWSPPVWEGHGAVGSASCAAPRDGRVYLKTFSWTLEVVMVVGYFFCANMYFFCVANASEHVRTSKSMLRGRSCNPPTGAPGNACLEKAEPRVHSILLRTQGHGPELPLNALGCKTYDEHSGPGFGCYCLSGSERQSSPWCNQRPVTEADGFKQA